MKNYNYDVKNDNKNVIIIFCFLLLLFSFFILIFMNKKTSYLDSNPLPNVEMKAFEAPQQEYINKKSLSPVKLINREFEVEIIPQASYKIYGRVYTKHYVPPFIELGEIMPYDMVIAWEKMAAPEMYKMVKFEYEFYDRYVWWKFSKNIQDNPDELSLYFSNNHIIPANKNIRKALDKVKIKDIVYMEGFLVNLISHENGVQTQIDTSLWREDDGEGACEIIYVTRLITRDGEYK